MQIELLEANVENTSAVKEAVSSPEDLLARFDEVRRSDLLDETAANMLERQYV